MNIATVADLTLIDWCDLLSVWWLIFYRIEFVCAVSITFSFYLLSLSFPLILLSFFYSHPFIFIYLLLFVTCLRCVPIELISISSVYIDDALWFVCWCVSLYMYIWCVRVCPKAVQSLQVFKKSCQVKTYTLKNIFYLLIYKENRVYKLNHVYDQYHTFIISYLILIIYIAIM